jgi:hypothetical protein
MATVEVKLTPAQLAEEWCALNDEDQAQFFIEAARLMASWGPGARSTQMYQVGKHLLTCECSSDAARSVVQEIAGGIGG